MTIGKQITSRIFVRTAVSLNSPQNPIYQVEYLLTRHLQVILEQGELGALGGDIKYSTRFYGPGGGGERPGAGAAAGKARAKRMISAVHFNGDPGADPDHLRRITKVREGDEFSRRRMVDGADRLKDHYVKESYLEATVFPSMAPRGESAEVTFDIVPGPRIGVTLAGAGSSERKLKKALKTLWSESRFGGDLMIEAEDLIRRLLHEEGYYACYVRTQTLDQGNERQVTFRIDRGEKVIPESVTIQGATSIPEQELRQQVLTGQSTTLGREPLKPEVLEADTAAIENLYRARGYLQAAARAEVSLSPRGDRALVALVIDEGPVSRVSRVRVTGCATYGEEPLQGLVASREGEPYLPARVESDRAAIQAWYDARGYPEAKVEAAATMDGQLVDLEFQVSEGGRKSVKEVEIAGNTVTATAIIRRQVPFAPGDPISSARVLEVRQKLMKLGLFSDVQISWADAPGKGDGQIMRVTVRDAPNLFLRFGAGYDTDNGPRGSIAFGDTNLFGRGRYADIAAVYGSKLQRVAASYREPTPFDWLTSATLTPFYQNWVRESFTQRQYGGLISAEKKMTGPVIHYLTYTNQYSEVYDLTVDPKTFQEANPKIDLDPMRLADLAYAIVRDTRQPLLSATTGTYANALIRGFSPAIGSDKRFLKLFLQGGYYRPLGWGVNWATSARFGFAWRGQDEPIPLQEKYFAGGDSTVRGFGQDELGYVQLDENGNDVGTLEHGTLQPLGGEGLLIVNNELRKGIFGGLSGALFVDAGNVYPRPTQLLSVRPRFTAGIGLRYDTPVGPVRLEYGHKLDREEGEPGGELFLSLGQAF